MLILKYVKKNRMGNFLEKKYNLFKLIEKTENLNKYYGVGMKMDENTNNCSVNGQ